MLLPFAPSSSKLLLATTIPTHICNHHSFDTIVPGKATASYPSKATMPSNEVQGFCSSEVARTKPFYALMLALQIKTLGPLMNVRDVRSIPF
jgi:hypothetical protein